ncbi:MAG TPA: hypothetical protein VNT79_06675, partial [Phycisphaerae bacterium]|nr:hypothetical protein [Phycisphaerae bacterium]
MLSRLLFVFLVSFASSASGQNQPEPDEKQDESGGRSREERQDDRRERRGGEGREGRGRDRVRGDRDRWERFRNATPEERERMRADRLVEMAGRTYELTDEQRTLVKGEIEKMGEERKALMGADYDRYQQLREQMFSYWRDRSANEGEGRPDWRAMRNNPEFQKLREELRSLEQKYPLDWDASMRRVESLLPPEQAAKG